MPLPDMTAWEDKRDVVLTLIAEEFARARHAADVSMPGSWMQGAADEPRSLSAAQDGSKTGGG